MSIDTAAKRRSAATIKPILKAPIPDGTIDNYDRAHISWLYSGIAVVTLRVLKIVSTLIQDLTVGSSKGVDLTIASILSTDLAIVSTISTDLTIRSTLSTDLDIESTLEVH